MRACDLCIMPRNFDQSVAGCNTGAFWHCCVVDWWIQRGREFGISSGGGHEDKSDGPDRSPLVQAAIDAHHPHVGSTVHSEHEARSSHARFGHIMKSYSAHCVWLGPSLSPSTHRRSNGHHPQVGKDVQRPHVDAAMQRDESAADAASDAAGACVGADVTGGARGTSGSSCVHGPVKERPGAQGAALDIAGISAAGAGAQDLDRHLACGPSTPSPRRPRSPRPADFPSGPPLDLSG